MTQTSGKAVAALVLGVAGFFVFPIVCSILAIVFGRQAREEIRRDPRLSGDGLAQAGEILGWVGIALGVVALALFVLFVAIAVPF